MIITLHRLLIHAQISDYHAGLFFKGALWKPPHLRIVGQDEAAFVSRCYGAAFRELVPDLTIQTLQPPSIRPAQASPRPLWKAGKDPKQTDLLTPDATKG